MQSFPEKNDEWEREFTGFFPQRDNLSVMDGTRGYIDKKNMLEIVVADGWLSQDIFI